ncbi:MAG TPA: DUF1206 domain-containing protein [Tepidisphaeraceae bacterium]|jgi:hypothetical protein|nr:DUF1206 domain-containing protein [Tepidisphaeraceae bacterium]
MSTIPSQIASHARDARHHARPFLAKLARIGYAAKGTLYVVVGLLAAASALGVGGRATGSRGALQTLIEQPFGKFLLGVVAVGLIGYSIFQFVRAVEDPEQEGNDRKAMLKRAGFFISGVIHASLFLAAARMLVGRSSGGGEDSGAQSWTATIMEYPLGRWLIAAIGVGIIVYGIAQFVRAWKAKLSDQMVLDDLSNGTRDIVRKVSRFGLAARGVVFSIIGSLLIVAAWQYDASEAKGLGGALATLERQPFGPWLLGLVALGLIAYGAYQFVLSRYRRIGT